MASAVEEMLEQDGITLPVAYCLKCHKEVVVHGRMGQGARAGQLLWCCLFCDDEVMMEEGGVRYHSPGDLKELGYQLVEPEELEASGGGCGTGGGCGSGGGGCHS